jgi:transposase-like protein
LVESLAEYLPEARWQSCVVHFYRNVFSHVPATKARDVAKMLKAIHAQEDRAAAEAKTRIVIDELLRQRLKRAAELVHDCVGETLTYYAFPDSPSAASWRRSLRESDRCAAAARWIKLKTNNPLERLMREIRRRTKVVGAFPDGQSCLNLAAARLRHIAGTQWSTRRYISMDPLKDLKLQEAGAAVA